MNLRFGMCIIIIVYNYNKEKKQDMHLIIMV